MTTSKQFFVSAPKSLESLLVEELRALGAADVSETRAGAYLSGGLDLAYRVCLWSRLANRVFMPLAECPAGNQDELYRGIKRIDWSEHLAPEGSLAVRFRAKHATGINNTHFGALKVKDAIVDQMRERHGARPSIDLEHPDVRVNVFLNDDTARVSLDLSGESLHRRGYRSVGVSAPLKENLAAAILLRAGWPEIAHAGGSLIDPMCGSGTLLIEAAMIASDWAPGVGREHFGFCGWRGNEYALWARLWDEAVNRRDKGFGKIPQISGYDVRRASVKAALENLERAGLAGKVRVERKTVRDVRPTPAGKGLVAVNPPYGERLGDEQEAARLYSNFGEVLKAHFQGWRVAMIVGNPELGFRLGIRSQKPVTLYNGALECKLLRFEVDPARFFTSKAKSADAAAEQRIDAIRQKAAGASLESGAGAEMLANRLRKNLKTLGRWARRSNAPCYRLYDADLPEYAFALDLYYGEKVWAVMQEYQAPKTIDSAKADARLADALGVTSSVLEIPREQLFLKVRRKQKNKDQYEKHGVSGRFHEVTEGGSRFLVNFEDYLDTGLFLDHRPTRLMIRDLAKGKRFLNLFAYTGTATVHAAAGGASGTTTVEMSSTYLDWARKNLRLNGLDGTAHEFIRADCLDWLDREASAPVAKRRRYGLIFLDPPTFSNSKRMEATWDVQRDYTDLIKKAASLLDDDGLLIFSTNYRRFKMDAGALTELKLDNISAATIPQDFARNSKIHQCWRIRR
ncbi:MAG: bifunctional 23S rRNA (guanine(2069)-N(7))-methyltransferase RlmK/23S rRNA (guanine(2445)-N(2))-methyltransferase RlmL [Pseudomonadota bacterium]